MQKPPDFRRFFCLRRMGGAEGDTHQFDHEQLGDGYRYAPPILLAKTLKHIKSQGWRKDTLFV